MYKFTYIYINIYIFPKQCLHWGVLTHLVNTAIPGFPVVVSSPRASIVPGAYAHTTLHSSAPPPLHSGMDCVQEGITPTSPCSHPRVICGAPPSLKDGLSSAGPPHPQGWTTSRKGLRAHHLALICGAASSRRDGLRPGRDYAHITLQSSALVHFSVNYPRQYSVF